MKLEKLLLTAGCALGLGGCSTLQPAYPDAPAVQAEARRQQARGVELDAVQRTFTSMDICAGSPIPSGWIVTGGHWNPTACGNPTTIRDNVLTITQFSTLPPGSILNVCAGQTTPGGWVVVGGRWDPTSCGRPTTIYDNVISLRRVQ